MASSPWNSVPKAEINFLEIQDEEIANEMQKQENATYHKQIIEEIKIIKKLPPEKTDEPGCSKATTSSQDLAISDEILPEEVTY
jgi:hypothetical protein